MSRVCRDLGCLLSRIARSH